MPGEQSLKLVKVMGILFCTCLFSFTSVKKASKPFIWLHSLKGTWFMKTAKGGIGETWDIINDTILHSRGFFVKGIDTVTTERVILHQSGNEILYTSTAENQNSGMSVDFKLTSFKKETKMFVFENPEHDFPKRIVYELVSADSLHAWIDGGFKEPDKRKDFFYRKQK